MHNTWYHHLALIEKLDEKSKRLWYAARAVEHGWSRNILAFQIAGRLHARAGKALNNFKRTLPPADSDFVAQVFKDPYLFDFLGTADPRQEHEVEASLVAHVERFLLELGSGFAFVGRQVPLEVGGDDFKLDLLFYHFKLRRFVVVELKAVKFDPATRLGVSQATLLQRQGSALLEKRSTHPLSKHRGGRLSPRPDTWRVSGRSIARYKSIIAMLHRVSHDPSTVYVVVRLIE